jgi:hypothetical protein
MQKRLALAALGVRVKPYRRDHEPRVEATTESPLGGEGNETPTTLVSSVSRTHAGHRRHRAARRTARQVVPRHLALPDRGPAKRSPAGPDRPACPLRRSSRALVDRCGGVVVAMYVH